MTESQTLETAFGQVLRDARLKCNFSQEKLALDCGLDRTYISLLERGLRQPSLRTIFVLAYNLQTTPSKLIRAVEKIEPKVQ
jgi:transcriptional regulator with XRE-family HTH domain